MGCRGLLMLALTFGAVSASALAVRRGPAETEAEDCALVYLAREVPRWSRENHCYSCHNNGDAARALYAAVRRGRRLPAGALDDTNRWLATPERWDHNGGEGPFSDKALARVQFAAALADAVKAGQIRDPKPLEQAARRLRDDQAADGSWRLDGDAAVGSPATYGRALLTFVARESLRLADSRQYEAAIARADRWLLHQPIANTPQTAAVLSVAGSSALAEAREPRRRCLAYFRTGQSDDGGWGPFAEAPPEPFDTALALLALSRLADPSKGEREMIARGRAFLIAAQNADGSWLETTRPSGGESYAERLSTTGWATLALLATE